MAYHVYRKDGSHMVGNWEEAYPIAKGESDQARRGVSGSGTASIVCCGGAVAGFLWFGIECVNAADCKEINPSKTDCGSCPPLPLVLGIIATVCTVLSCVDFFRRR